jgi:hypothetical protein
MKTTTHPTRPLQVRRVTLRALDTAAGQPAAQSTWGAAR